MNLTPYRTEKFDKLYAIYETSFPSSEQKPKELLRSALSHPDYTCYLLEEGEEIVGFSLFYVPENRVCVLLEYMAVNSGFRAQGYGSMLFSRSIEAILGRFGEIPIVIEIESTEEPSPDLQKNQRRAEFYRRNGCGKVSSFSYILGLKTEFLPPKMELMLYYLDHDTVSKELLKECIEAIYIGTYGRDKEDENIAKMFLNTENISGFQLL